MEGRSKNKKSPQMNDYTEIAFLCPNLFRKNTFTTAVRLKVEENQLVDVFGEIGIHIDGLKGR